MPTLHLIMSCFITVSRLLDIWYKSYILNLNEILSIALSVWYFIGLGFKVYSRLCYRCLKLMWVMAGNCYDEHIGTMIGQGNLKSGCLNRIWCARIVADNSVLQITPFLSDGLQDVNNTRLFWQTHTRLCSGWVLGIGIQTHCGSITLCH